MANLPSPIVGAGGGGQRSAGEQLLLGIAQQIFGGLIQSGMQQVLPQPKVPLTPEEQAMQTEQRFATQQLSERVPGLGDARVPTAGMNKTAMRGLASGPEMAPLYLEQVQAEEKAESLRRIRARTLAGMPKEMRPNIETMFGLQDSGAEASTINSILPHILPPTEAEQLQLSRDKAEIAEIRSRLATARTDARFRKTMAEQMGLPVETVTDGMLTEWLRQTAPKEDKNPQDMAVSLMTTLISRSVVDPITGQANPAFSVEDSAARTEQAMQMFIPGFTLNLSEEQRAIAEAGGILRAAVAREKMNDPRIKDEELAQRIRNRFLDDFPAIGSERFEDLLTEAIRSNILTGFGG